jgi:predicted transcriptional regulator
MVPGICWQQKEWIMETTSIKEEARRLVDRLPDDSTWNDLMHEIYVRQSIEKGLADSEAGRTTSVEEVSAKIRVNE